MFILVVCFFVACEKTPAYDKGTQLAIDDDSIAHYIKKQGIAKLFTKDPQGYYYEIITQGTGNKIVALSDSLRIHYVERLLLNQRVLDSTSTNIDSLSTLFQLRDAIEGWELGIPHIQVGGTIRLIVPSSLAYQNRQIDSLLIPNSILDFNIRLISAKDSTKFTTTKIQ